MAATPENRPRMTKADVEKEISAFNIDRVKYPVVVLGVRGYYKNFGATRFNERGIYDDAMFIDSPDHFSTYNANTDPSINRTGIATLTAPQIVMYKVGIHGISGKNPRQAFRQDSFGITVTRDDKVGVFKDSSAAPFWIDIHDGGNNTTSSEGCQTIPKQQWPSFNESLKDQLKRNNQKKFPYILIEYK